ncbi:MAG: HD-GYP domain-containing protein [Phycisphaerales bacterium]|nr:HD-GYP domain-containing protein [Phycisphaerales bacterium]
MNWDTLEKLNRAVELKDASTAAHTARVALYSQAVAESLGLAVEQVERVVAAAIVHDIGKIDIPSTILAKPGRLTPEEFEVMKTHTVLGHRRLLEMGERDPVVLDLVRSHHERLDGSGYPDGLVGHAIPVAARLFAVIDTFDAMTSLRPYREEVGEQAAQRALEELRERAGTWYWPEAVGAFVDLYKQRGLTWILHHFNDRESMRDLSAPSAAELADLCRDLSSGKARS